MTPAELAALAASHYRQANAAYSESRRLQADGAYHEAEWQRLLKLRYGPASDAPGEC